MTPAPLLTFFPDIALRRTPLSLSLPRYCSKESQKIRNWTGHPLRAKSRLSPQSRKTAVQTSQKPSIRERLQQRNQITHAPWKAVRDHRCLCWTSTWCSRITRTSHQPVRHRHQQHSIKGWPATTGQPCKISESRLQTTAPIRKGPSTCRQQTRIRIIDSLHTDIKVTKAIRNLLRHHSTNDKPRQAT